MTDGGLSESHNVAIDTDSGFLYLAGANLNAGRLIAYDLTDPENPAFAGQVSATEGVYVHDAQIVTFTTGPNAGKQIAYCANGGTGLDIYDVTDKSNMFRLSRTTYASLSYAHQCWLSEDRQYLYLNDELDGVNQTVIFDVSNLSSPFVAGTYNSAVNATDHNLYVRDGFIFEAEYRAGLRVFCAADPLNPVQVGWFDT
jgi:choice-of-anchor B domain-containing protein